LCNRKPPARQQYKPKSQPTPTGTISTLFLAQSKAIAKIYQQTTINQNNLLLNFFKKADNFSVAKILR
jgi:hypothetical protein